MKQSKLSFKTRRIILSIITAIFVVAAILFYEFFTTTELGLSILVIFLALFCALLYFWLRCPHCNKFLYKLPMFSKYCPHCGNELE